MDGLALLHRLVQIADDVRRRHGDADSHPLALLLQRRLCTHPHDVIDGKLVAKYNFLIFINVDYSRKSGKRKAEVIKKGGILIYDGYGIHTPVKRKDINVYRVDAMDTAAEMQNDKAFNMLILGGLLKIVPMVKLENVILGLKKSLPARHHDLIPMNEAAIKKGMEIIQKV